MTERISRYEEIQIPEEDFAQWIDDLHDGGVIMVAGIPFSPSHILKECDPVAWRCMMADHGTRWQCTNCLNEFDDENDADDCCPLFECESCGKQFEDEDDAEDCCLPEIV